VPVVKQSELNIVDFTEAIDDDDGIVSDDKISSSSDTGISLLFSVWFEIFYFFL